MCEHSQYDIEDAGFKKERVQNLRLLSQLTSMIKAWLRQKGQDVEVRMDLC